MKIKNRLRVWYAQLFMKETILFSRRDPYEQEITKKIHICFPSFSNFKKTNLNNFKLIFPLTEDASYYFNKHYAYLNHKKAIVPPDNAISICKDKKIFTEFLIKNDFQDNAIKISDDLQYPYILKKRIDAGGINTVIINNDKTKQKHHNELNSEEYIKQEYIEGMDEYAMHIIMHKQEIIFSRSIKHQFKDKIHIKGDNFRPNSQETVNHQYLLDLFKKILNTMTYEGICCIDYKLGNDQAKIFEINARMGSSLVNHIDEAVYAYSKALNIDCSYKKSTYDFK